MKKKVVIIVVTIIILFGIITGIILLNKKNITYGKNAFYLEDELYDVSSNYEDISLAKLNNLISNKKSFVIFTYASFCPFQIPSDQIFKTVFKNNNMKLYAIGYDKLKGTEIINEVEYAPSVVIFKEGKIVAHLDANSDEDYNRYQDTKEFQDWLSNYVYLTKKEK